MATWNIAAINNNPFEYWITPPKGDAKKSYEHLMSDVEKFILCPGDKDVKLKKVFTHEMFEELLKHMENVGWEGLGHVRTIWEKDYSERFIISEFLTDGTIGKKRLTSMPDRLTNTIGTKDAGNVCRPAVCNCYPGRLSNVKEWWSLWKDFIFNPKGLLLETGRKTCETKDKRTPVWQLFTTIKRSKYPAITEEEEKISIPLQTLCLALFDAVLVHMINSVSSIETWHPIKIQIANALNMHKNENTIRVLEQTYSDYDLICLQEVSNMFLSELHDSKTLSSNFDLVLPPKLNRRDQNSVLMLQKSRFSENRIFDLTEEVMKEILSIVGDHGKSPVGDGDIVAAQVSSLMVASFHGDTNGLASIPVVRAVQRVASKRKLRLVFGLDANTHRQESKKKQGVTSFRDMYRDLNIDSCWGKMKIIPDSTFNGRTFLQAQLNKSVRSEDMKKARRNTSYTGSDWLDRNPKDFILFTSEHFKCDYESDTTLDNTGKMKFRENDPIPTLEFPSDHSIVSTTLVENAAAM